MCPGDIEKSLGFQRDQMYVVAPERSVDTQINWPKRRADQKDRWWKTSSRGQRGGEVQEWNEMPKVLLGYSGGRLPGRSTKARGREEEAGEEGRETSRKEIVQEVVAGIEKKARAQTGQSVKQNLDCSQIETQKRRKARDF